MGTWSSPPCTLKCPKSAASFVELSVFGRERSTRLFHESAGRVLNQRPSWCATENTSFFRRADSNSVIAVLRRAAAVPEIGGRLQNNSHRMPRDALLGCRIVVPL